MIWRIRFKLYLLKQYVYQKTLEYCFSKECHYNYIFYNHEKFEKWAKRFEYVDKKIHERRSKFWNL